MDPKSTNKSSFIKVYINDYNYLFSKSFTVFQACLEKRIYIPRFCYHNKLKIAGNCRMCLLEEKRSLKPIASCAVPLINGMILYDKTRLVKRAREGVLEYLLINHPLDCPICDQGGECDLQDQTMVFGGDRGRFYELKKRSTENKNIGPLIKTFLNRCIQCARCTRFLDDLAENTTISLLGRGLNTEISNFISKYIKNELSGNIIDLCPVGALTSKTYAFRARSWELVSVNTFDITDSLGSNVKIDFRGSEAVRVLPRINEKINEEWISDTARFYLDAIFNQRLLNPLMKIKNKYRNVDWINILISYKISLVKYLNLPFSPTIGPYLDNETLVFLKHYFFTLSGSVRNYSFDFRNLYIGNISIDNIKFFKDICFIGLNLKYEIPVLNMILKRNLLDKKIINLGFLDNNFFKNKINLVNNTIFIRNFLENTGFKKTDLLISKFSLNIGKKLLISNYFSTVGLNEFAITRTTGLFNFNHNFSFDEVRKSIFFEGLRTYQGTHGDYCASISHLIIPTSLFFENNFSFLNTLGYLQFFSSSYKFNSYLTRKGTSIIQALGEFLKLPNSLKNEETFTSDYSILFFSKFKSFKKLELGFSLIVQNVYFFNKNFFSFINNVYSKNSILRNSRTMGYCYSFLNINDFNYVWYKN